MKNRQAYTSWEYDLESLMLDITLLAALGFPPACINSDVIKRPPTSAAQCKGVFWN